MDVLTSAEFRKRYAKLTEPTTVTANGHAIGRWIPATYGLIRLADEAVTGPEATKGLHELRSGQFNSRPFTPVPKKGK